MRENEALECIFVPLNFVYVVDVEEHPLFGCEAVSSKHWRAVNEIFI